MKLLGCFLLPHMKSTSNTNGQVAVLAWGLPKWDGRSTAEISAFLQRQWRLRGSPLHVLLLPHRQKQQTKRWREREGGVEYYLGLLIILWLEAAVPARHSLPSDTARATTPPPPQKLYDWSSGPLADVGVRDTEPPCSWKSTGNLGSLLQSALRIHGFKPTADKNTTFCREVESHRWRAGCIYWGGGAYM